MEMFMQDLESVKPKIKKHFGKYPSASISAMFRNLRNSPRLSLFGDYPILSVIVEVMHEVGVAIKRRVVQRAMRQSQELKGRRAFLNCLLKDEMTTRSSAQSSQEDRNYNNATLRP